MKQTESQIATSFNALTLVPVHNSNFSSKWFLVVPLARCEAHVSVCPWQKICRRPNRPLSPRRVATQYR